ncbi:MAG: ACP S-malonyltransferase [Ardenticatenaceae bacterium]|nr:ACP S-malonyltransferase [Ardenticatenaceae bacterium]MCB8988376.1 ACP S-malonyltransferase [Ardenticatenaceae bacterium]
MSRAFLFPGQGSQQVGMGQTLYERSPAARAVFDEADALLGFPLSTLCFTGPEETLTDTLNQQPALFTTSMAMMAALAEQDAPPPAFVAGHSLGELAALAAAGSLTFADGLALVRRRGELMKAAGEQEPGAMAAILGLDLPLVTDLCARAAAQHGRAVQVANDNCPGQIVISGDKEALATAVSLAEEAGARKTVVLPITIAAHSPLMASASADFATAVNATPIHPPQIPIIGNVTARPLPTPDEIRTELKAQLTSSVLWTASMNYLLSQGVDTVVEVGPGDVLLSLMKRIDRQTRREKVDA